MTTDHQSAPSLRQRLRAVDRALRLLHTLSKQTTTFEKYAGHLLLAFFFIGNTTGNAAIRRRALTMGRERARHWNRQWPRRRRTLNARNVLDGIFASYAAEQLGISQTRNRQELQLTVARCTPRLLLGFDPARQHPRSYEQWYCALIATYFCEQHGIELGCTYRDVFNHLPRMRPYPKPGTRHYRDSIYAVTHVVYTLNDYNRSRLSPRRYPYEFRFLKSAMPWALAQEEADTIGEIVDSLAAFGVPDTDPLMAKGRTFLLENQRRDGGWGDEDDEYGRFHTVWTGIDGLRDYAWRR